MLLQHLSAIMVKREAFSCRASDAASINRYISQKNFVPADRNRPVFTIKLLGSLETRMI
jgi:hypothetical protein